MIRALWIALQLAVLVAVGLWFVDHPGTVSIEWMGWGIEAHVGVVLALAIAVPAALLWVLRFPLRLSRAPRRFREAQARRKRERGYRALTRGMVAVAAGDPEIARRMSREADALLNEPPLTMLLAAQAAQLSGDERAAHDYFTAMLERPDTAFLGRRGLLLQATRAGRTGEALEHVRGAALIRPKSKWVLTSLFDLEERSGNWSEAEEAIRAGLRVHVVTADEARRRRAVLHLEHAAAAERAGDLDTATSLADTAHELEPGFPPAAAAAARFNARTGKEKRAFKILARCWRTTPHPDLARAFDLAAAGETPLERFRRLVDLTLPTQDDPETRLAVAGVALDARLWGEARTRLGALADARPTPRILAALARLEREERNDEAAARDWSDRAATAPADPAWVCRECGANTPIWGGRCPVCGGFDALEWRSGAASPAPVPAIEHAAGTALIRT